MDFVALTIIIVHLKKKKKRGLVSQTGNWGIGGFQVKNAV